MKKIFFCMFLFLFLFLAGCTPSQKAQQEKILKEHSETADNVRTVGDNATKVAIQLSRDYQEAIKDNNIESGERALLRRECDDRQLLRDKLKEETQKFKNYMENKQVVLTQAGLDIEEDKKLLRQAGDSLKNVEGSAKLCDQLFGKSSENIGGTESGKENEQPDFKGETANVNCKKIGEDKDGYWQYEVTVTGEAMGPIGASVEVVSSSGGQGEKFLQSSLKCNSWSKTDPTYGLSSCNREEGQPLKTGVTFTGYYSSKDMSLPESWLSGISLLGSKEDKTWLDSGYYVPVNITFKHPEFEEAGYAFAVACDEDKQEPKIPQKPLPCSAYWGTEWIGDVKLTDGREGTIELKFGRPASSCEDIPITAVDFTINGKTTKEFGGGPASSYMRCNSVNCLVDYDGSLELQTYYHGDGVESFSTFFTGGRTKYKFDKDGNAVSPQEMRGAVDLVGDKILHTYGKFVVKS